MAQQLPIPAVESTWLTDPSGKRLLQYELVADNRLLLIHWEPNLQLAEGEAAARMITQLVSRYGCVGALSDTRRNTLDWAELVPLLVYEEYPKAVAAGLRYHANVMALNPADALSTFELNEELAEQMSVGGRLINEVFNDYEKARQWLFSCLAGADQA